MSDVTDEIEKLNEAAEANINYAGAKLAKETIDAQTGENANIAANSIAAESASLQQQTLLINQNTEALKRRNEANSKLTSNQDILNQTSIAGRTKALAEGNFVRDFELNMTSTIDDVMSTFYDNLANEVAKEPPIHKSLREHGLEILAEDSFNQRVAIANSTQLTGRSYSDPDAAFNLMVEQSNKRHALDEVARQEWLKTLKNSHSNTPNFDDLLNLGGNWKDAKTQIKYSGSFKEDEYDNIVNQNNKIAKAELLVHELRGSLYGPIEQMIEDFRKNSLEKADSLKLSKYVKDSLIENVQTFYDDLRLNLRNTATSQFNNSNNIEDFVKKFNPWESFDKELTRTVDAVDQLIKYSEDNLVDESDSIQEKLASMNQRDLAEESLRLKQQNYYQNIADNKLYAKENLWDEIENSLANSIKTTFERLENKNLRTEDKESIKDVINNMASFRMKGLREDFDRQYHLADNKDDFVESFNIWKSLGPILKDASSYAKKMGDNLGNYNEAYRKYETRKNILDETYSRRSKEVNAFFTDGIDDEKIRKLRQNIKKNEGYKDYLNSLQSEPFRTFSEMKIVENFAQRFSASGIGSTSYTEVKRDANGKVVKNPDGSTAMVKHDGEGLLMQFEDYRNSIISLRKELSDSNITYEQRVAKERDLESVTDKYKKVIDELIDAYESLNKETSQDISNEKKKNKSAKDNVRNNNNYNYWKYALVRNTEQQDEFNKMPKNFATTGNLKDSFLKTVFNKSVGYRQRQGLTGFLANMGYSESGTLASVALGMFGKALTDATKAAVNFAKESVEAFKEIESVKTNLGIVYGSQSEADALFNEIAAYSVKSPFGVQTVSEFAVLLKQSGVYASDLMTTLKQIGDVAGGNQQKFGNIANAFAQIEANGKATTRQLRQFATAGIPIYKELSKELGVSVSQVRKMTEQSKITADIIEKVFTNMTTAGGMFENAVNIGAKTIAARKQNLQDARQLAFSEAGEWIVTLGEGGNNDSAYKSILKIQESLYGFIGDFFRNNNLKNDVNRLATNRKRVEDIKGQIDYLKNNNGSKEAIDALRKELREVEGRYSSGTERAARASAWEAGSESYAGSLPGTVLTTLRNILPSDLGNSLIPAIKAVNAYDTYKMKQRNEEMPRNEISYYEVAGETLGNAFVDAVDKAVNKNENSLFNWASKSNAAYESTSMGKLQKDIEEKQRWDEASALYKEYSKFIDYDGSFMKQINKMSKDDYLKLYTSGIVSVNDHINPFVESFANNSSDVYEEEDYLKRQELLKQKSDNWKYIHDQLQDTLENVTMTEDETARITKIIKSMEDDQGNLLENTEHYVSRFVKLFNKTLKELSEKGDNNGTQVILNQLNRYDKSEEIVDWQKTRKDVFPLWQRILSSSLGIDTNFFKFGAISNGTDAVNLFRKNSEKSAVNNLLKASMTKYGVTSDLLSNIKYSGPQGLFANNSKDGTKQIDWTRTYNSFMKFATSLDSATVITQTFADSLQSENDALVDFLASSITKMEEPANIYDIDYQNTLGNLANSIKATDANAYDLLFEELGNGFLKLRENATDAAYSLLKSNRTLQQTTSSLASMKQAVENNNDKLKELKFSRDLAYGTIGSYNGLSSEQMSQFIEEIKPLFTDNQEALKGLLGTSDVYDFMRKLTTGSLKIPEYERQKLYYTDNFNVAKILFKMSPDDWIDTLNKRSAGDKNASEQVDAVLKEVHRREKENEVINSLNKNEEATIKNVSNILKKIEEISSLIKQNEAVQNQTAWANMFSDITGEAQRKVIEDIYSRNPSGKALRADKYAKDMLSNPMTTSFFELFGNGWFFDGETQLSHGNSYIQQRASDYKGITDESYMHNFRKGFYDENGSLSTEALPQLKGILDTYQNAYQNKWWVMGRGMKDVDRLQGMTANFSADDESRYNTYKKVMEDEGELTVAQFEDYLELSSVMDSLIDGAAKFSAQLELTNDVAKNIKESFITMGTSIKATFKSSLLSGFSKTMNQIGENMYYMENSLITQEEKAESYRDIWKNVASEILNSIGPLMTETGLTIMAEAAKTQNWGLVAAGATLAAAGGVAQIASGWLDASTSNDTDEKKAEEERLETLRDLLKEIIDQAKIDAEYYEKNFRHQNALSINEQVNQSVNDAIITPNGNIISTHPDDYLIATKTPDTLLGNRSNSGSQDKVVINCSVVNNTNSQVRQEQKQNSDGTIDIITIIEDTVGSFIASEKSDNAFAARQNRINGRSYSM